MFNTSQFSFITESNNSKEKSIGSHRESANALDIIVNGIFFGTSVPKLKPQFMFRNDNNNWEEKSI